MKSLLLSFGGIALLVAAVSAQTPDVPAVPPASLARIQGQPLTSPRMLRPADSYEQVTVDLELNNDKDRLGARFQACRHPLGYDQAGDCESFLFVFPGVAVDREKKAAFADGQQIVEHGRWSGLHTTKPWKLKYKVVAQREDTGFDRIRYDSIEVWLER